MIRAQNSEAIERQVLDKRIESLPQSLHRTVVVHVLGIDIGDDSHSRAQLGERAVALIGLHHHPLALAQLGVGA